MGSSVGSVTNTAQSSKSVSHSQRCSKHFHTHPLNSRSTIAFVGHRLVRAQEVLELRLTEVAEIVHGGRVLLDRDVEVRKMLGAVPPGVVPRRLEEEPPGEHPSEQSGGDDGAGAAGAVQEENAESSQDQPSQ